MNCTQTRREHNLDDRRLHRDSQIEAPLLEYAGRSRARNQGGDATIARSIAAVSDCGHHVCKETTYVQPDCCH